MDEKIYRTMRGTGVTNIVLGDCDYGNGNCRRCSVNYKRSKAAGRKVQDYVLIFKGAFRGTVLTAGYNRLAACPRRHFLIV